MMATERFLVVGLARVRSSWFADVATWSTMSVVPIEFLKCVSAAEVRKRLSGPTAVSAVLVDAGATGVDRALLDAALERDAAFIVVTDPRSPVDWASAGASALLEAGFGPDDLVDVLAAHARPTPACGAANPSSGGTARNDATPITSRTAPRHGGSSDRRPATGVVASVGASDAHGDGPSPEGGRWSGALVSVTGVAGTGRSTLAMALGQGLAGRTGNAGGVVVADLAARADLAMYHDVRDVVPGLPELAEAARSTAWTRNEIRQHLFEIEQRDYRLLLGRRRARDWTAVGVGPVTAALDALRSTFRVVVADVDAEFDGEQDTGSSDMEHRNAPSRVAATTSEIVVLCGDSTLRGLHGIIRLQRELGDLGVDPARVLIVVNRAPRSPRARAEVTAALAELGTGAGTTSPLFLPDRRQIESVHATGGPLPAQLVAPLTNAVAALLARLDRVDPPTATPTLGRRAS